MRRLRKRNKGALLRALVTWNWYERILTDMSKLRVAVVLAMLAVPARSAEPASFSPAALMSRQTDGNHAAFFIAVFPPAGKEFEISVPLIPRWFAYGPSGRSVYAQRSLKHGRGPLQMSGGCSRSS